jgi:hypothetical protein
MFLNQTRHNTSRQSNSSSTIMKDYLNEDGLHQSDIEDKIYDLNYNEKPNDLDS